MLGQGNRGRSRGIIRGGWGAVAPKGKEKRKKKEKKRRKKKEKKKKKRKKDGNYE